MGVAVREPLPLITAQENAGKINLPSQYISLQGADLACCFFHSLSCCNQTCCHCGDKKKCKKKKKKHTTMKHNHNEESHNFGVEGVEICWIPKRILMSRRACWDCLESWNQQSPGVIFMHGKQTAKVRGVRKRARLSNGVDEFFGTCPNMVSNIFTMPRTLCWLNEAPFQVNRTLASVTVQVQQQSDPEGCFRGKHLNFSLRITFKCLHLSWRLLEKWQKKLPACSRVTALYTDFPERKLN